MPNATTYTAVYNMQLILAFSLLFGIPEDFLVTAIICPQFHFEPTLHFILSLHKNITSSL